MPLKAYQSFTQERHQLHRLRTLRPVGVTTAGHTTVGGKDVVNFSSNNYMGLANHPELIRRAQAWTEAWGVGSTASRLVCGNLELFERVEDKLAQGKKSAAALVFNSGFQANSAILASLLDRHVLKSKPLVFSDRLNHASIHHGCRAAGISQIRYGHNDLNHLEALLKKYATKPCARFIVSETVFSMDGDRADVAGLLALKERFGAFLYLDEAHAAGVLGPDGFGLAAAFPGQVDLVMGTFSKGLGGFGAYAACSKELREYLINHCSGFIYATALPPSVLGAMDAALELLPGMTDQRAWVLHASERVRQAFRHLGLSVGHSSTQIVPLWLGDESRTLEVSQLLEEAGILGIAIRPPTVPPGSSRIRFSLTASHSEADIERLIATVRTLLG